MKASSERWPAQLPRRSAREEVVAVAPALPGTLAQIYDAHFDFVWRNARRLGVPEASADDVAQDVFIVVQRRLVDFDGRTSLKAWIFGILVRVARDHRRSFLRKGARCVSLDDEPTRGVVAATQEPTPSELAERAERVRLLDTLLNQLDDDKRTLLILSELEECSLREIAELLGSNINTVHSRLRVAKQAFEKVYARWHRGKGNTP